MEHRDTGFKVPAYALEYWGLTLSSERVWEERDSRSLGYPPIQPNVGDRMKFRRNDLYLCTVVPDLLLADDRIQQSSLVDLWSLIN